MPTIVDETTIPPELSRTHHTTNRAIGSPPQKGVTTYGLSPNRQNPLAGAANNAVFNTFRRTKNQILFWLPPMVIGYATMKWAVERYVYLCQVISGRKLWLEMSPVVEIEHVLILGHRNEYLNSKAGIAEFAEEAAE
jgi:hypothetical protein